jgi:hypothetical protein
MCELILRCLEIEMVDIKVSKEVGHKFSNLAEVQFCRKVQMSVSNGKFSKGIEELDSELYKHDRELQIKLRKIHICISHMMKSPHETVASCSLKCLSKSFHLVKQAKFLLKRAKGAQATYLHLLALLQQNQGPGVILL